MGLSKKFNYLRNFQSKLYFFLFETEFHLKKYSFEAYFDNVAKKLRKFKGGL